MSSSGDVNADLRRFAEDLCRLRLEAGNPSYRKLEAKANYSRTSLAAAAKGRALPSLELTRAFVSACEGDVQEWERRWRQLHLAMQGLTAEIGSSPGDASSPWPERPVEDGVDPDEAGCSVDAVTVHARRIALTGQRNIIGQIELRYCRRARAAWGRFKGYPLLNHLAYRHDRIDVVVEVVRESDGKCVQYEQRYGFDYHWGDLLTTDSGLFYARATVLIDRDVAACGETNRMTLA